VRNDRFQVKDHVLSSRRARKRRIRKAGGESNVQKNANILRIPRRTVEAPQVPHEHGVEKWLDQKRAEQMTLMSAELLTPVASTVETRSGAQSLAHPMSCAYICLITLAQNIRTDGMSQVDGSLLSRGPALQ
jgi:hypothetical protein